MKYKTDPKKTKLLINLKKYENEKQLPKISHAYHWKQVLNKSIQTFNGNAKGS